jgi:Raf kinase inhibitor-like YbhB/YbcL family protein
MLEKLPSVVGRGLKRFRPGLGQIISARRGLQIGDASLLLQSPAFTEGRPLPVRYTADGEGVSPPLRWSAIPDAARSLLLVVEDADSPTPNPLVHAIATGIPVTHTELVEAELVPHEGGPVIGKNSYLKPGWLPPDPPPGHGPHRYAFQLFALDYGPQFDGHPGRSSVIRALEGHVIARGLLIGTYQR